MESILFRFPDIVQNICLILDDKSIATFGIVNRQSISAINSQNLIWSRIIRSYCPSFPKSWDKNMKGFDSKAVHSLAMIIKEHYKGTMPCSHTKSRILAMIIKENYKGMHCSITKSPLHFAAEHGMIYLFQKTKATDITPCDEKGRSPLHYAAEFGHLSVFKFIINAVDDKNPRDFGGVTPLHLSVKNSHMLVVLLILDQIQDKNPSDGTGQTPLHIAAKKGNY